jgi:hypothetical protein
MRFDYLSVVRMSPVLEGFHITTKVRLRNVLVFQNCEEKHHGGGVPH